MAITPNDILMKEFNNKFRGYDPEQVNDFLDIVRVELEKSLQDNQSLNNQLNDANDKLEYFGQLQESLNSSIIIAQEAADRLKQNARKEAELILFEAEREADRIIKDATDQSKNIYEETETLRQSTADYRRKLKEVIHAQLEMVDDNRFDDLFEGSALTPAQAQETARLKDSQASQRVDALVEQAETEMQQGLDAIPDDPNNYLGHEVTIVEENVYQAPIEEIDEEEEDLGSTQVFNVKDFHHQQGKLQRESKLKTGKEPIPLSREELAALNRQSDNTYDNLEKDSKDSVELSTESDALTQGAAFGETIQVDLTEIEEEK